MVLGFILIMDAPLLKTNRKKRQSTITSSPLPSIEAEAPSHEDTALSESKNDGEKDKKPTPRRKKNAHNNAVRKETLEGEAHEGLQGGDDVKIDANAPLTVKPKEGNAKTTPRNKPTQSSSTLATKTTQSSAEGNVSPANPTHHWTEVEKRIESHIFSWIQEKLTDSKIDSTKRDEKIEHYDKKIQEILDEKKVLTRSIQVISFTTILTLILSSVSFSLAYSLRQTLFAQRSQTFYNEVDRKDYPNKNQVPDGLIEARKYDKLPRSHEKPSGQALALLPSPPQTKDNLKKQRVIPSHAKVLSQKNSRSLLLNPKYVVKKTQE